MMADLLSARILQARLTVKVQRQIETSDKEVDNRQRPGASDSIVRENVPHDGEFGM
jgi:hypothetical protein